MSVSPRIETYLSTALAGKYIIVVHGTFQVIVHYCSHDGQILCSNKRAQSLGDGGASEGCTRRSDLVIMKNGAGALCSGRSIHSYNAVIVNEIIKSEDLVVNRRRCRRDRYMR